MMPFESCGGSLPLDDNDLCPAEVWKSPVPGDVLASLRRPLISFMSLEDWAMVGFRSGVCFSDASLEGGGFVCTSSRWFFQLDEGGMDGVLASLGLSVSGGGISVREWVVLLLGLLFWFQDRGPLTQVLVGEDNANCVPWWSNGRARPMVAWFLLRGFQQGAGW